MAVERSQEWVHVVFGWLGIVGGLLAAWYAHDRTSSWLFAVFVLLVTLNVVGRGVGDVITDPNKGRRALFFGMPAVVAAIVVAGTYRLWEIWWLTTVLGAVGYLIGAGAMVAAFPRIAEDEQADTRRRSAAARTPRPAAPPEPVQPPVEEPVADAAPPSDTRGKFDLKLFDFNKK